MVRCVMNSTDLFLIIQFISKFDAVDMALCVSTKPNFGTHSSRDKRDMYRAKLDASLETGLGNLAALYDDLQKHRPATRIRAMEETTEKSLIALGCHLTFIILTMILIAY